jgi:hypothetical protein
MSSNTPVLSFYQLLNFPDDMMEHSFSTSLMLDDCVSLQRFKRNISLLQGCESSHGLTALMMKTIYLKYREAIAQLQSAKTRKTQFLNSHTVEISKLFSYSFLIILSPSFIISFILLCKCLEKYINKPSILKWR